MFLELGDVSLELLLTMKPTVGTCSSLETFELLTMKPTVGTCSSLETFELLTMKPTVGTCSSLGDVRAA